jgi:16S rRNA (uracil1498-N3)-methyltransferase
MNRFFLTSDYFQSNLVTFPSDLQHQMQHVLRLREGDQVFVLDNTGVAFAVELVWDAHEMVFTGRIVGEEMVQTEPVCQIDVCFSLTNRDKVELILQKVTELGVVRLRPFVSSRSLVQSTSLSLKRVNRWEKIIREASEQSCRAHLPELEKPLSFVELLRVLNRPEIIRLVAWEKADQKIQDYSEAFDERGVSGFALMIGPEGGFSEEEILQAEAEGCEIISLGARTLRMETAAMVFPALVLHDFNEL